MNTPTPDHLSSSASSAGQQGFALLEAIVALVILSASLGAFYALVSNSWNLMRVLEGQAELQQYQGDLVAWVELQDLSQLQPAVEITSRLGPLRLELKGELVEPTRQSQQPLGGEGLYEMGLYALQLEVFYENIRIQTLDLRRVAWRQTQQAGTGL